jgi:hypothetical protein
MIFIYLLLSVIAIIQVIRIVLEYKSRRKTKESDKPPVEEEIKENDLPRNLKESSKAAIERYENGNYYISFLNLARQIEMDYLINECQRFLRSSDYKRGDCSMSYKELFEMLDDDSVENKIKKHVHHSKEYTEIVNKEKSCSNCAYMWTCRDKNYCFCSHSNYRCIEKDFYCQEWHDSDYTFEKYFK